MNNTAGIFVTVLISFTLTFAGISDAEAKRFGGARSFGGKSSYSSPYRRSATSKPTRSASQQKAYNQNQAARQSMSRRGGFMGMLGGLALGGLLGAMFFGGAFEGFNFMDILIFGGVAYLLFKLFAAKASVRQRPAYGTDDSFNSRQSDYSQYQKQPFSNSSQQRSAGFDTDFLFDKNKKQNFSSDADFLNEGDSGVHSIPAGFDEADFLVGAKGAFKDLQKAWDKRDLAEIRGLTTDKVFAEIQDQLKTSTDINKTDVLKIDAELLSIREIGSELEAVVLFDTIIREDVHSQAEQVREVWHFIKSKNSLQPKWYLDGIQQMEE
ncbi:MAG: Tim44 domain-containing protein [Methylococcales bacterium]|nr:Tim44 domain-containing protein [Methylococcales bacterium]